MRRSNLNDEKIWVTIKKDDIEIAKITSRKNDRTMYYLYYLDDKGEFKKCAKDENPINLERKIFNTNK